MRRGTNLPRMAGFNQTVILDVVRRADAGLSRAQLARRTGLSAQTVTNATRRLLEQGLVREEGETSRPGPGRPGTLLHLDARGRYAIGVHLDPAVMTFVVLDLAGNPVAQLQEPTPVPDQPERVVAGLVRAIEELVDSSGIDRTLILGVGIATPGPIDVEQGVVMDPPHLPGWHGVPLRDAVAEGTGLPVILDKDTIAAASAHLWNPGVHRSTDFMFFYLGTGVAMSLVIRDDVVRGSSGNAGEAGHFVVDPGGETCECGKRGCLGAVLRAETLVNQGVEAGVISHPGSLSDPREIDTAFSALCAAADAGDTRAVSVLEVAGRRLGMAAVVITDLCDLDTVIVGGPLWSRMEPHAMPALEKHVAAHQVPGGAHSIAVLTSPLGPQVGAVGAGCLVLGQAFTPRPSDLMLDA
ncbi:ROK family transcriptional regulator [Cellulomonas edaphi]|uniref:ROK family transcriptional regulator n=1 Tax=Cellulomonas edaphi TaxID=3053468 RepID=A0ABT7S365_9CELL|nr:ROK family transcriptional regulator [Cellulomons edaphi]MDM7830065.1 ROK family transcriptional regulator [Cellulomons edaphi]